MKYGDDQQDQGSNVISLAGVRKQAAKDAARAGKGRGGRRGQRTTAGQWLTSGLLVALAVGGVLALTAPLLRAAGILGG
ncbi:MAG: hypothetical protein ACK4TL_06045 [Hyphomicrobiaceae bacterium]